MWDLIESLLPSWLLDPRRIVTAVRNLIAYVHDLFRGAFNRIRDVITAQFPWLVGFFDAFDSVLSNIFLWAHWLVTVRIPAILRQAYDVAYTLARTLFNQAIAFAQNVLDTALSYARALWHAAMVEVVSLRNWALHAVADIVANVRWLLNQVVTLLTDPAKLAEWLAGAMLRALGRYVWTNARRLARVAWPLVLPAALASAHLLESIITDIF